MLYSEIIVVYSEIHTKHINILCGQNVELLNVKLVVHIVTTGVWRVKESILETTVQHSRYTGTAHNNAASVRDGDAAKTSRVKCEWCGEKGC